VSRLLLLLLDDDPPVYFQLVLLAPLKKQARLINILVLETRISNPQG
jgi:hypothetical protein